MLALTRKPGQSIQIGDDIVVTVVGLSGANVRIGISGPRGVNIARTEVTQKIKPEWFARTPEDIN